MINFKYYNWYINTLILTMKKDFILNDFKKDFPFFKKNKNYVYLNSSATSLKLSYVIDELNNIYSNYDLSTDRSNLFDKQNEIIDLYNSSIKKVANHINANIENVFPTYGTTDFLNKIIFKIISNLNDNDEIILGKLEHAANILPWINISKELNKKIIFKWYEIKDWKLDLDNLKKLITNKTKVISVAHVYNTTGAKNDLLKIREIVGEDIILVVDGAQAISHIKIDVKKDDVDYYIFGSHKAFGPYALGFAYIKDLNKIKTPWTYGGGNNVFYDENKTEYKDGKLKFIAGTKDIPGVIAFGKSIDYIDKIGINNIENYNNYLKKYAENKIGSLKNVIILNKGIKSSNLFFEVKNVPSEDVGYHLSQKKIILRTGSACVKLKNKFFNSSSSIRASFHIYNTTEDIDKLYDEIKNGGDFLGAFFDKRETSEFCK